MAEWRWVRCFADQLRRCGLTEGEVVAVLSRVLQPARAGRDGAPGRGVLGGRVFDLVVPTPANDQPVAIRSTGASQALQGNPAVLAGLAAAGPRRRLHRRGAAPRAGARHHPRRRRPRPDDLQRAPGDVRAPAVRSDARRTGRTGARPPGGGVDDAGDVGRRHRPDGAPGRRGDRRIDRRDRGRRLHRPLARRAGAGVPGARDGGRHRRARARRPQPHVQALPRAPGDPDRSSTTTSRRSPATASTPTSSARTCPRSPTPRAIAPRTRAPTWAGGSTTRPGGTSSSSTTSGT